MALKLGFRWRMIQHGITQCRTPGTPSWEHGCLVWYRKERFYWFHPDGDYESIHGPWLTLAVAQVAVENMLREKIVGAEPTTSAD